SALICGWLPACEGWRVFGVIADDLTGALDAALLLHAGGVRAPVIVGTDALRRRPRQYPTVILDVDSRGDDPDTAYSRVREAARFLLNSGYTRLNKKMSSTFQGHIGREVDAALDEAGSNFAIVVPSFPANGRVTRDGVLYVDGVPLAETGVGRHPTSPITDSYIPRVLQAQTRRKVGLVGLQVVRGGAETLRTELGRISSDTGMAVVDAVSDGDLEIIAEAARALVVTSGGSALAGKLPLPEDFSTGQPPAVPGSAAGGALVLAGSVSPVTAGQVAFALAHGLDGLALDAVALLEPGGCGVEVSRAVAFVVDRLKAGRDAMVYTTHDPESQRLAAERAAELGISRMESGLAIAGCLSEVAFRVIAATGLNRLIVAGGDTSSTVCARLGLEEHVVLGELQTGIPLSLSSGRQTLVTVLKSGNFGTEDFFPLALSRLKPGAQ
ncbi:MAG TPA: four-carbon acid sugar kinase family protein, partial [Chloroflexota bacterium]